MTDGAHTSPSDTNPPPFATLAVAESFETDLFPTFNGFLDHRRYRAADQVD